MTKLAISIALFILASPASNISGVWNLDMQWAGRDTHSTGVCTFKQDDDKLSGSCANASSTISGTAKDHRFTWQIDVEQEGQKGRMTFDGTLDESGTTVKGTCAIVGGAEGTFTMKKQ